MSFIEECAFSSMAQEEPSTTPEALEVACKKMYARGYDWVPRPLWVFKLRERRSEVAKMWTIRQLSAACDRELANGNQDFGHLLTGLPKSSRHSA
jgi:hypothetical protein